MRKIIIALFLFIAVICGVVIYGSAASIVPERMMTLPTVENLSPYMHRIFNYSQRIGTTPLTVSFSHEEFFYDQTIYVTISADNPNAEIYYTVDGSIPTIYSERFIHPLEFVSEEEIKGIVLKAIAIDDSGWSSVFTHSYFIGKSIDERFSTYVFSISADPDDLYDYIRGILVPGKIRDDYLDAIPSNERLEVVWRPSNYRMRGHSWERTVYVEVITQSGARVISQNSGMRVHGNVSRFNSQKSLRLIAREEYGPEAGKFNYNFFGDYLDIHAQPITSHDTLILRNDGQDFYYARIRTPLVSVIAHEAGYTAVSPQAAAAVFLNGEYYGFVWINIKLDNEFLKNLYDSPESDFDILDGGNNWIIAPDESIIEELNQLTMYAKNGLDDYELQFAHNILDVDNLLFYYAMQAYISNSDWPDSNIAIWRYNGETDTGNPVDELDGRWRFLLWDLDKSMSFDSDSTPETKSIHRLLNIGSPIFKALLQRPEYINQFTIYICDMAFEHFSTTNVDRVIRELDEISLKERIESSILHETPDQFLEYREYISDFIEQRPDYILDELRELFGFTKMYKIQSDGTVKINTLNGNEGVYFIENSVPVYPLLEEGQVFDHWLINGEKRYDKDLIISYNDADANDTV
ncbi:MAG: CotH kinase family protein, partial [Oscillospiraceae bacterium]|nr:CotH kinase family protein [Oscillospiraceae bacterium]